VLVGVSVACLCLGACGSGSSDQASSGTSSTPTAVIDPGDGGRYAPVIDPASFVTDIDNPYLPFRPGATWVYEGTSDGQREHTQVVVTSQRKQILGISAVVVRDTVSVDGEVAEDTFDWYAQDKQGNVWYLGEDTKEYENGKVSSTEGSWQAGVAGAQPGIVMMAAPKVHAAYRQEYLNGQAEDLAQVLRLDATEHVPAGTYDHVAVIKEWTPLEPDIVEDKYYASGVGMIIEQTVAGGSDRTELVSYTPTS
jgi:hypothetical protein